MISVRKKKYSEQKMKVHIAYVIQLSIVLDMIDERKKNNLGGKIPIKTHDSKYYNKPVMFQI